MSAISLCMLFFSILIPNSYISAFASFGENVHNLPFLSIYEEPKELHLIKDYFTLAQHIDMKQIILHLNQVSIGFKSIKEQFLSLNDTSPKYKGDMEEKLILSLEHISETIEAGIAFLPQARGCKNRVKRDEGTVIGNRTRRDMDLDIQNGPVDTRALFPGIGKLFSWVTGSLDQDAGTIINQNFANIKKLTKASVKFAEMFNATLNIQKKQAKQIKTLKQQVTQAEARLRVDIGFMDRKIIYQTFLENMMLVIHDIMHNVDMIFQQTDAVEIDRMGPLSRDKAFIKSIVELMGYDSRKKRNNLFLLKLGAKVEVEICHWAITIMYKFPFLETQSFTPYRTLSIPKKIKGKFFELEEVPHLITWSTVVYTFTEKEYNDCEHYTRNILCRKPAHAQRLLDNCVLGLLNKLHWDRLVDICPVKYVKNPKDIIMFTWTHMFFFLNKEKYVTMLCENHSKTIKLEGSGVITIPNGCSMKSGEFKTYSLGHIGRSADITLNMDRSVWFTNISHIASMLKVSNVKGKEVDSLWEDSVEDEKIIEKGVLDTMKILKSVKLTPEVASVTIWTLIIYTVLITLFLVVLFILVCIPGSLMSFKACCCSCGSRKREREVRTENL